MPKIYRKGQVILPKTLREQAGLDVDDEIVIEARGREIVIRRAPSILELRLPQPAAHHPALQGRQETDTAWEEHIASHFPPPTAE